MSEPPTRRPHGRRRSALPHVTGVLAAAKRRGEILTAATFSGAERAPEDGDIE